MVAQHCGSPQLASRAVYTHTGTQVCWQGGWFRCDDGDYGADDTITICLLRLVTWPARVLAGQHCGAPQTVCTHAQTWWCADRGGGVLYV